MNKEDTSLIRDFQASLMQEKIVKILKKHQKSITYLLSALLIIVISWNGYAIYVKAQAQKYSTILHKALLNEQKGETQKAVEALKEVVDSSAPASVKQIAMLKYAAYLANSGKEDEAKEIYLNVNSGSKFDAYFKEYAGLNAAKILINSNKIDQARALISKIEKKSKILTYYIAEQKGLLEWQDKNYQLAAQIFEDLAKNPEAQASVKQRAADMVDIYNTKYAKK